MENGRARSASAHPRLVVLAATISISELAALLDTSPAAAGELVLLAEAPLWSADSGNPRLGWRSARAILSGRFDRDPEALSQGLDRLHELRAGLLELRPGAQRPALEPIARPAAPPIERYSDERLLDFVCQASCEVGRPSLSRTAFTRWALPLGITAHEVCVRFSRSWDGVLQLLGLREAVDIDQSVDHLVLLREAAAAVGGGEHLSLRAFDNWAARMKVPVTGAAVIGAFGSWNAAKETVGLPVRAHGRRVDVSDDEVLERMRQAAEELSDRTLSADAFDEWCAENQLPLKASLVATRYGSWNAGKRAAGLIARPRGARGHNGPGDRNADR